MPKQIVQQRSIIIIFFNVPTMTQSPRYDSPDRTQQISRHVCHWQVFQQLAVISSELHHLHECYPCNHHFLGLRFCLFSLTYPRKTINIRILRYLLVREKTSPIALNDLHFLQRNICDLTHSTPAVPNCCCSKSPAPYWSKPQFLIFDIRALWRSGLSARAPECQKLKMVG